MEKNKQRKTGRTKTNAAMGEGGHVEGRTDTSDLSDESFYLFVLVYYYLSALEERNNLSDPPPWPCFPVVLPSYHLFSAGLFLSPTTDTTHHLHLLRPPEGIIFTLTTSINLTLSHAQTHTHAHTPTEARTYPVDHVCTGTSSLPYQSLWLRSLNWETEASHSFSSDM